MHLIEKVLARASGSSHIRRGEILEVEPDLVYMHDTGGPKVVEMFNTIGFTSIQYPERVKVILDHEVPPTKPVAADHHKEYIEFAKDYGLERFYAEGICHQIIPEKGYVQPGHLVLGNDSHTVTGGALGALATGIGFTETAVLIATGKIWLKVPEIVRYYFEGTLSDMVMGKDVMLLVLQKLGVGTAIYKAVEYAGPAVKAMSMDARMALCNMAIEIAGKAGFVEPDEVTMEFLGLKSLSRDQQSDPDVVYDQTVTFDINDLEPMVACPHTMDNISPVKEVEGVKVHQAFIGSCTGGRYEDLEAAARILKGRKVHPDVKAILSPTSKEIFSRMVRTGLYEIFADAGVIIIHSTCGPCTMHHLGVLCAGEVCISSSSRNHKGRMGSKESSIYVASPLTVAASAVEGKITDPRRFI
jgi:3-isopropylmalate dehydratase large subunit